MPSSVRLPAALSLARPGQHQGHALRCEHGARPVSSRWSATSAKSVMATVWRWNGVWRHGERSSRSPGYCDKANEAAKGQFVVPIRRARRRR